MIALLAPCRPFGTRQLWLGSGKAGKFFLRGIGEIQTAWRCSKKMSLLAFKTRANVTVDDDGVSTRTRRTAECSIQIEAAYFCYRPPQIPDRQRGRNHSAPPPASRGHPDRQPPHASDWKAERQCLTPCSR